MEHKEKCAVKVAMAENLLAMEVAGHAEGSPAACAGVSALVYALHNFVAVVGAEGDYTGVLEPGHAGIAVSGPTARDDYVRGAFNMAVAGMAAIAKTYGKYVELAIVSDRPGPGEAGEMAEGKQ